MSDWEKEVQCPGSKGEDQGPRFKSDDLSAWLSHTDYLVQLMLAD
jgi:hypothetical protein